MHVDQLINIFYKESFKVYECVPGLANVSDQYSDSRRQILNKFTDAAWTIGLVCLSGLGLSNVQIAAKPYHCAPAATVDTGAEIFVITTNQRKELLSCQQKYKLIMSFARTSEHSNTEKSIKNAKYHPQRGLGDI
ncbi:hypothetical protein RB195_001054 [Necator americanus]|uniref:Uncharacterized protein n=1 Tax=Necator americanus TaxID=51031 RepID=A0ABR1DE43_NECAM